MNKKALILPVVLLGLGLASCSNSTTTDQTITIAAAKGISSMALVNEISSSNCTMFNNGELVANELSSAKKGVVLCDAVKGLNKIIGNENNEYGVTKIISYNSDALVKLNDATSNTPADNSVIVAYGKGGAGDVALKTLVSSYWNVNPSIKYVSSTQDVLEVLKTGTYNGAAVDYVVLDEVGLATAKLDPETYAGASYASIATTLNDAWKDYTTSLADVDAQEKIPGLVTFVSKTVAESKSTGLDSFYSSLKISVDNAVDAPNKLQDVINGYSKNKEQQVKMFGATATAVGQVQDGGANGLGFQKLGDYVSPLDAVTNFLKVTEYSSIDYSSCFYL